jgi:plastocyanin
MRRLGLAFLLVGALMLAACGDTGTAGGGGGGSANTITMGGTSFSGNTNITIKAGESVTFDDSSGGSHQLVTGTNGQFTAATGAPTEFSTTDGILFNPGDKKTVIFPTAGTFQITCKFHPPMQATITVTS